MASLVTCVWLISALCAYFLDRFAINCCEDHHWVKRDRMAVGIWSLVFGPFALVIALETLFLAEMALGLSHRKRCR